MDSNKDLPKNISNLSISTSSKAKKPVNKKGPVAESWEDDEASTGSDTETENILESGPSVDFPAVPPPTPASPTTADRSFHDYSQSFAQSYGMLSPELSRRSDKGDRLERRPDKSTAAASRLIAGALGVRAPKSTAEQREYEKAVREKERRRRDEEKDKVKEEERKKAAVWED